MKQGHARLRERAGEGAGDGALQVGLEHDGVADGLDGDAGGDGDPLLDEGLLHADTHVAEHEFEEVFGLECGGAAQQGLHRGGAGGGGAGGGHGLKGRGDLVQKDRRLRRRFAVGSDEEIVGRGAEVAVAVEGRGHGGVGGAGDGFEGT